MAYRRKQTLTRSATFVDNNKSSSFNETPPPPPPPTDGHDSSTSSLAAQAIRASALHRDSSLSSAYGNSAFTASSNRKLNHPQLSFPRDRDSSSVLTAYEDSALAASSNRTNNHPQLQDINKLGNASSDIQDAKNGFWGVLARKAKTMLDENGNENPQTLDSSTVSKPSQSRWSYERLKKQENPAFQKGSEALKDIGGKIRKSLEEGLTMVENTTNDLIQETKKLQIRRKNSQNNELINGLDQIQINQSEQENHLRASRDVANAMAAKAKLLLRELKTVKADLAFAKLRCSQLEDENKVLREGRQKSSPNEDDDLISLQLETLLAEKGRLAHENSVYARENRFLREIVDFHQFNAYDVASLDENFEADNDDFDLDMPPHLQDHSPPRSPSSLTAQNKNTETSKEATVNSLESPVVDEKGEDDSSSPVLPA